MTLVSTLEVEPARVKSEIYSDPKAAMVLQFLLKSSRTLIAPSILSTDEIGYPQLESILGSEVAGAELLSKMAAAGALIADLVDKAPTCPECGSLQVSTRYLCAKCFNFDIERSYLYEHLKCGKVASDDAFKKGGQLVCPKCQAVMHNFGVEYRAVGAWYKCNACSESFNVPAHSHFCRPKHHQFTSDRIKLFPVFQYRLNPKAVGEIKREILTYSEALPLLEDLGIVVNAPHDLTGKSGQPHSFDIVADVKGRWGGGKVIAVDVIRSESPISPEMVRNFAMKIKDVKPAESYLLAVPGLSDEARELARGLKVNIVEGASVKEAATALLGMGAFKEHAHQ